MALPDARRHVRRLVSAHPAVYYAITWFNPRNRRVRTTPETDLVIEGFPRSGNSFALHAFKLAQSRAVRVAHHLHVPAQVIRACRLEIPCLVLIREPGDAVASLLIRDPGIQPEDALKDYVHFYSSIAPYSSEILVADFRDVTQDFGLVIQRANRKFGTNFEPFAHTDDSVGEVFRRLEEVNRRLGQGLETQVARPSAQRGRMRRDAKLELESQAHTSTWLAKARDIYRTFSGYGRD